MTVSDINFTTTKITILKDKKPIGAASGFFFREGVRNFV